MRNLQSIQKECHKIAVEKGWHERKHPRSFGDLIALCHSELSEALEAYREKGSVHAVWHRGFKPEGVPVELADTVIRILDICETFGIDLEHEILMKMEYNRTRKQRHGGKFL